MRGTTGAKGITNRPGDKGKSGGEGKGVFADELPRAAFGVRPACWRCRKAGVVQKREQAPRTPNASRSSVAALPRRALAVGGIDYRADFAGQIDWNGRLCHMITDLVGNRRHDDYAGRERWKS